ncbi:MAG: hypothetical protein NWE98_08635 [Candidatus Bathyarchaeota archaeon]|nr:hypothetical protein [Candidatus Bathyarchaeota archaeon]
MRFTIKKLLSMRTIGVILAALLVLSALNTYLILEGIRSSMSTNTVNYDYVLSQDGSTYKLKNMLTGIVTNVPASASTAVNSALVEGKSVYLNPGTYVLTDDIVVSNKLNAKIMSDGAIILGNGHRIIIYGEDHTASRYALISGFTIINATIRVENSFATTIQNVVFENVTTAIEFANTKTWSEYNKVENCQFINFTEGIAFRTPVGNATGSYASSIIERCSFNHKDFSVGINVERLAEFSDSQMQDVRFWLGENGRENQTAMLVDGSMYQTLLLGVVFESFTDDPVYLFAIDLAQHCDPAPILDGGVSFLGNWTAKVHNPYAIWLSGVGSVFSREHESVPVGTNNQYAGNLTIQCRPLKVSYFKPKIEVSGGFSSGETVTVRIRIEYLDNVISNGIVRTFTSSESVWLTDDEMLALYPSQSIIWAILVDAKTTAGSTAVTVKISGYGTAG